MRRWGRLAAALSLLAGSAQAHTLDLSSARVSLRDDQVEVVADLDLLLLLGADPTAVATASEADLDRDMQRAQRLLVAQTRLEADGLPVPLVLRELPAPPELRAQAAVLSASGRAHGELARVRFEAKQRVPGAATLALSLPPALGPAVVTFAQLATRYAAPGGAARFPVLRPAAPQVEAAPWLPIGAGGAALVAGLGIGAVLLPSRRRRDEVTT